MSFCLPRTCQTFLFSGVAGSSILTAVWDAVDVWNVAVLWKEPEKILKYWAQQISKLYVAESWENILMGRISLFLTCSCILVSASIPACFQIEQWVGQVFMWPRLVIQKRMDPPTSCVLGSCVGFQVVVINEILSSSGERSGCGLYSFYKFKVS